MSCLPWGATEAIHTSIMTQRCNICCLHRLQAATLDTLVQQSFLFSFHYYIQILIVNFCYIEIRLHFVSWKFIPPFRLMLFVEILQIWVPSNPRGAERLSPGIIASESDLYPRRLWGLPREVCIFQPWCLSKVVNWLFIFFGRWKLLPIQLCKSKT